MQLLLVLSCVAILLWFPAGAEGSADCADRCNRCADFAERGYCERSSPYYDSVTSLCKRTCGLCPGGDQEEEEEEEEEEGSGGGDTEGEEGSEGPPGGGHGGGEAQGGDAACLRAHNDKRALHEGTSALQWDDDLARQAKQWADYLLRINQMKHSSGSQRPNQGENLYMAQKSAVDTCTRAVQAWYSEVADYPFYSPPRGIDGGIGGRAIGHFTQIVWKNTRKVGVGVASGKKGRYVVTYIVARYSPPGNYVGQFAEQVGNLKRRR